MIAFAKRAALAACIALFCSLASATLVSVNTSGASRNTIYAGAGLMQIQIGGTWSSASVDLQRQLPDGTWQTVATYTADAFQTIDVVRDSVFRFNTTGSPTLKCDVILSSGQIN